MKKTINRARHFLRNLFRDWYIRGVASLLFFIGLAQLFAPLLIPPNFAGENASWWQQLFLFFVTPWNLYLWIIAILITLVFVTGNSLWKLGGFDLELGLSLHSEPLTDSPRRFLGMRIANFSPRDISQLSVTVLGVSKIGKTGKKPGDLAKRRDKFLWTSWEPPRIGTKDLVSGFETIADLLEMQDEIDLAVFTLQSQSPYLGVPPGKYRVDMLIRGVYTGKRFEMPVSFVFRYIGGMQIKEVEISNLERLDWHIRQPIDIEVLPPAKNELPELLERATRKLRIRKAKAKNEKSKSKLE